MLRPLITDYFDFKDYLKAYEYIQEKKDEAMKVIVNIQEVY